MLVPGEFERRAPYAPISAMREFFERIQNIAVPARVDRKFLQRLNVASNNEWALLSALKFLEVVDEHGVPTHAYRQLQTTDKARGTLRHLVETAYAPLFAIGGAGMSTDDLRNYFRVSSSPSQAKNAARFFREMCEMAGIGREDTTPARMQSADEDESENAHRDEAIQSAPQSEPSPRPPAGPAADSLIAVKAALLEKLPPPRDDWSAAEYTRICDSFLHMMRNLDGTG